MCKQYDIRNSQLHYILDHTYYDSTCVIGLHVCSCKKIAYDYVQRSSHPG